MSAPGYDYTFTVFTPTYNRAHTLSRVWDSLCAQTYRDFEWLVVDDGSTDGTTDLIDRWTREASFPIRLIRQDHRGKAAASNVAIREARGRFLLTADSDDSFTPDALERLKWHWDDIPEADRDGVSAVTGLAADEQGRIAGTVFPSSPMLASPQEVRLRYKVKGEKWGFQRTDVLRQFAFPEIDGYTGVIPESIVWNAIGRRYKERYINEVLRTYWQDQGDRLSAGSRDPAEIAPGALLAYESFLNEDIGWLRHAPLEFYLEAAKYVRMSWHGGRSLQGQLAALRPATTKILWLIALPLGTAVYVMERLGLRRHLARAWLAARSG